MHVGPAAMEIGMNQRAHHIACRYAQDYIEWYPMPLYYISPWGIVTPTYGLNWHVLSWEDFFRRPPLNTDFD